MYKRQYDVNSTRRRSIEIYRDGKEKEPFVEWIRSVSVSVRARILAKLDRIETGNLGDYRSVGDGVFEFRLHFGPGYRVYFGEVGNTIVLLLCGGDKSSQKRDIKRAKSYWKDYLSRRKA